MDIKPSGFASASWGAQLINWDAMALDNEGATLVLTLAASAAKPAGGGVKFKGGIEIHSQPDVRGRIPPRAGKILLLNYSNTASGALQFLDKATGTITAGPVPSWVDATKNQWGFPLLLPNGWYLLGPAFQSHFGFYNPWDDLVVQGPAVPAGSVGTSTVDAYGGGVVGADDLVYLAQGRGAVLDGGGTFALAKVHILDPAANTLDTTTGPDLKVHSDYATVQQFSSGHLLPDGSLFFNTMKASGNNTGPWRISKATGAWVVTEINDNNAGSKGASLTADGKMLILASQYFNLMGVRLADNVLVTLKNLNAPNNSNFFSVRPLQNGKTLCFDGARLQIGIWDHVAQSYTEPLAAPLSAIAGVAGMALNSSNNFVNAVPCSDGDVILLPGSNVSHLVKLTPFNDGKGIPAGMRESRFYSPR